MFVGATSDNRFRAFDSKTGKELWVTKLDYTATAVPMTYMGKNGKQYVAIVAATGGGGGRGGRGGSAGAPKSGDLCFCTAVRGLRAAAGLPLLLSEHEAAGNARTR